ncbi:hypothetical protein CP500_004525 [Tychonema bourrellyi FEM_GT703]|uniref:Uncharacterized protein n=1 Tax=Tychonema bourrellyi FEM_GT703 TaxID=2040638 RepID=A0A2G4F4D8_9CYAN|nr:hypothetical protein [Tychonema bourrellyi]PHX56605.1 hypothetical protein CP500_004525 [Tychonema bourrellyi FEM_GT703]
MDYHSRSIFDFRLKKATLWLNPRRQIQLLVVVLGRESELVSKILIFGELLAEFKSLVNSDYTNRAQLGNCLFLGAIRQFAIDITEISGLSD